MFKLKILVTRANMDLNSKTALPMNFKDMDEDNYEYANQCLEPYETSLRPRTQDNEKNKLPQLETQDLI